MYGFLQISGKTLILFICIDYSNPCPKLMESVYNPLTISVITYSCINKIKAYKSLDQSVNGGGRVVLFSQL